MIKQEDRVFKSQVECGILVFAKIILSCYKIYIPLMLKTNSGSQMKQKMLKLILCTYQSNRPVTAKLHSHKQQSSVSWNMVVYYQNWVIAISINSYEKYS
jgi:hypothetical protein